MGIGFKSHIGFGRHANEDACWLAPESPPLGRAGRLMAVADGMGGHKGGGFASQYVCRSLNGYYHKPPLRGSHIHPAELCRRLTDLIFRIDRSLRNKASTNKDLKDMGTTLSCLVLTATQSIIAHVGDSRIYRWRNGHLSRLTKDHTFVQEMISEGEVDPAMADSHPLRHLLTQAVGTAEPLEHVFARIDPIKAGDRFLLCTDGLHNFVSEERIAQLIEQDGDGGSLAAAIVDRALANGTRDNVTALVAMVAGIHQKRFTSIT